MPCKVISTYRRADKNSAWHTNVFGSGNSSPAFKQESVRVKLPERRKITQIDDLTLEIEVTWDSRADYENFMTIPSVTNHFNLIEMYNQNAGITQDPKQFIES